MARHFDFEIILKCLCQLDREMIEIIPSTGVLVKYHVVQIVAHTFCIIIARHA